MNLVRKIVDEIARGEITLLRERLLSTAPEVPQVPKRSDYDLGPGARPEGSRELTPAAVLVPVVARKEPTLLFTRRTPHLSRHAGQVSFPGGRVHDNDLSLVDTALRETQEETGIVRGNVRVAGFLESYETGTGFAILPVVGLLTDDFEVLPDPNEVEEVFEVPLAFLLDGGNRERRSMEWEGRRREFYAFTYGSHYIWGATAGILVSFADRLMGS
ncbi:MAG: CoA pyrophosphatase [Alphaproteobacteria bacterium]|nr:CoA pyrophosphatase [Alphaproteobacteria bacterium]